MPFCLCIQSETPQGRRRRVPFTRLILKTSRLIQKHTVFQEPFVMFLVVVIHWEGCRHPRERSLITQWSLTEPILHTKESRVTSYSFWVSTPALHFHSFWHDRRGNGELCPDALQGFLLSSNQSPNSSIIQGIFQLLQILSIKQSYNGFWYVTFSHQL